MFIKNVYLGFLLATMAGLFVGCPTGLDQAELSFEQKPAGPAMWLEGEADPEGTVEVQVWAKELGPVLGYSVHLELDVEHLELSGDSPLAAEQPLGSEDAALYINRAKKGDVALGGTLRSVQDPEVNLSEPVLLGTVQLDWEAPGTSLLELTRAVCRRADGSLVLVQTAGAELAVEGGAQ